MLKDLRRFFSDEFLDTQVYDALAKRETDPDRKKLLLRLKEMEGEHHRFLGELIGETVPPLALSRLIVFFFIAIRKILGLTFTLKLLEIHEHKVVAGYRRWASSIPEPYKERWEKILAEEEEHEKAMMDEIEEAVVRYLGFIALGLSDAIIEITGVHAGFLGVAGSTRVAGVAGLVVGFSASISMAVAAYLKAKSEARTNPFPSALVTGISYLLSVILLALPYFVTESMLLAFVISTLVAIGMSMAFTFYVAVLQAIPFRREMLQNLALLLGTAFATYFFGEFLGKIFGIHMR
jgi:VIT1/CCC1 family predicted Fe2+/Mn2+ transporter